MFKINKLYRHINTLDIDLYVVSDPIEGKDEISFYTKYWNRHMEIFQGEPEQVVVKKSSYWMWSEVC
jgi:hypothetical protein